MGKRGRVLGSRRADTNDGDVGKRALCPAPGLQTDSPPRLLEHPLDPEGEDEARLGAMGLLLRRPL